MLARTIYSVLADTAARYPDRAALYQGQRVYTWSEYRIAVEEIAAGLTSIGIGKGDIVALASNARAEAYLADLGVMANGSLSAALYISYPPADLVRTLLACDARVVFVEDPVLLEALTADSRFPSGIVPVLLTGAAERALTLDSLRKLGRDLLRRGPVLPAVDPRDYAILYLTSGATGEPKMGLVTHAALVANIEMGPQVLELGPHDAMLAFLSPAHVMQRLVVELLPLVSGVPVWFAESLFKLPQEFTRVRPTVFIAPPRFWERVHASIRTEVRKRGRWAEAAFNAALRLGLDAYRLRFAGSRLPLRRRLLLAAADRLFFRKIRGRFGGKLAVCATGSAPLGAGLAEFFLAAGLPLVEGYGLTEGGVVLMNRPGRMKPGSVGQALPGAELRLAEDGELLVRGPTLFAGYYKEPEATAEVLRDGWLHTGDLAEIDAEGYVTITGRKKEIIVASSGRKIYPSRVEALFRLEPIVSHVILIGEGRPHVSALFTVNLAAAKTLPGMQAWANAPAEDAAEAPPVLEAVRDAVKRVNAQLADFEQIRKYRVLHRDFSIEAGELTATLKVRRTRALKNFSAAVDSLYSGGRE
ncbi:MAG TPA: AMP-binding protein [Bryobacteraceae bacterium]